MFSMAPPGESKYNIAAAAAAPAMDTFVIFMIHKPSKLG